jgi:ABC-type transporter Mla subunit MlaD
MDLPDLSAVTSGQQENMQHMIEATEVASRSLSAVIDEQKKAFDAMQDQFQQQLNQGGAFAQLPDSFSDNLSKLSENMQTAVSCFAATSTETVNGTTGSIEALNKAFEASLKKVEETAVKFSGG